VSRSDTLDFQVGEPTPVLRDLCMPFKTMEKLVTEYVSTGKRPDWILRIRLDPL
jgi:hypothetical protein